MTRHVSITQQVTKNSIIRHLQQHHRRFTHKIFNVNQMLTWAKCYLSNRCYLQGIQTWWDKLLHANHWFYAIIFHGPHSSPWHTGIKSFDLRTASLLPPKSDSNVFFPASSMAPPSTLTFSRWLLTWPATVFTIPERWSLTASPTFSTT